MPLQVHLAPVSCRVSPFIDALALSKKLQVSALQDRITVLKACTFLPILKLPSKHSYCLYLMHTSLSRLDDLS